MKRSRLICAAALLGLLGAQTPAAAASPERVREIFDAWYRVSACADPAFSRKDAERATLIARLRKSGLASRDALAFVQFQLEQRLSQNTNHLGPTCLPPLTALQSHDAWISSLREALHAAERLPARSIVHAAHGLMLVNLLEGDDGRIRALTPAQREGYLSLLRPEYRRLRPETALETPAYGPYSPEFALAWANRLGCPEALEAARAYVAANVTDRSLRTDGGAPQRREAGLWILADFNPGRSRALVDRRREALIGLACLPETDYDTIFRIQRTLKDKLPARCTEKWSPLVGERLRAVSR